MHNCDGNLCVCVHVLGGCIEISVLHVWCIHTYTYIVMYIHVLGGCIVEACEYVHFPYMIG